MRDMAYGGLNEVDSWKAGATCRRLFAICSWVYR